MVKSVVAATTSVVVASLAWMYAKELKRKRISDAIEKKNSILVIDIGSSSVRASAYIYHNDEWMVIPGSMNQYKMRALARDGTADYQSILYAVETVTDLTVKWLTQERGYAVIALGFSCFAMSLIGVDSNGNPMTRVLTYSGQAAIETKNLVKTINDLGIRHDIYNRTGVPIHPAYAAPQLLKFKESNTIQVDMWQSLCGSILRKWTNDPKPIPMSYSEASWTGLFDFREAAWSTELLDILRVDCSTLPPIQDPSIHMKNLDASHAKRWPLLKNTKLYLAVADGVAANFGSKCTSPEKVGLTIGTSAALRVVCPVERIKKVPKGLWCYRIDATRAILGGALTDGGSIYEWTQRTLNLSANDMKDVECMEPNSHGLTFLPFFNGERAPGWQDNATGTISGITSTTTSSHLVRAGLEGVALRLAAIYSLFGEYVSKNAIMVASGSGLSSSTLWRQIIADCIGREVWIETDAVELTSRGVAIFLGSFERLNDLASIPLHPRAAISKPCYEAHAKYLEARQQQDKLYHNLYD